MTQRVTVPWGPEAVRELVLPEGWEVISRLAPRPPEAVSAIEEEIERALREPIGLPRLEEFARRGRSACIVVDDRTRPTPVAAIVPKVIAELNRAGIGDGGIRLLIATGTHRDMTEEEIRVRVGAEVFSRHEIRNHHMFDPEHLQFLGKTSTDGIEVHFNRWLVEAETIVLVGCIEAHEIAGFGGGFKNLVPGCCGPTPVYFSHNPRFQRQERIGHSGMPRERCRFRRMIDECGLLLGPKVFLVNTVMEGSRPVASVAGDPVAAHMEGCRIYRDMASVTLDRRGDVVIAGARPLDLDLRLSMKACFNASSALKPGGVLIMVSAVPEGLGDLRPPQGLPKWFRHAVRLLPLAVLEPILMRANKSPDQAVGTVSLLKILKTASALLFLVPDAQGLDPLRAMGIEFFTDAETLIAHARRIKPAAEVVVMPQAGASFVAWE